jgi:Ca2+-binding RTX toxin-like protein
MNNSAELLSNAEFSLAAYANLDNGTLDSDIQRDALINIGMTEIQAQRFSTNYSVVTQFNDTNTGFSATVFKDASGNLTLAFRGTEQITEDLLFTDSLIYLYGAGYDQIIAMYNWWQRVSTPSGTAGAQYKMATFDPEGSEVPLPGAAFLYASAQGLVYLEPAESAMSTGELVDDIAADPDQKLDVTGHSLGAHLALAFNTLFASKSNEVTGFNTPGFANSPSNQNFFSMLGGEVPTSANSNNVTNVFANEANIGEVPWKAVAGLNFKDNPTGEVINVSIEDQALSDEPDPIGGFFGPHNHGQAILTDSLNVYNLLKKLDPNLDTNAYKTILNTIVVGTSQSYERIVDAIQYLFNINSDLLPTGNNNRNVLYEAIYGLEDNNEFQSYEGKLQIIPLLSTDPAGNFKVRALGLDLNDPGDSIAYRYALKELNPFVITGNNSIYDNHNLYGELNLANFSDAYLSDRADFLALKIELGLKDNDSKSGAANITYTDMAQNFTLNIDKPAGAGQLPHQQVIFASTQSGETAAAQGGNQSDRIYGFLGDDILIGGNGSDFLEGNQGDDFLFNNDDQNILTDDNSSDILIGGAGFDTYYVGLNDIIRDSDGQGQIWVNGQLIPLNNITLVSGTTDLFTNNDPSNPTRFRQLANGDLQLIGSFVTVQGFQNGDLGINLDGTAPTPNLTLINGTSGDDLDAANQAVTGSSADEELHGLDGNDDVFGLGGQDVLFGEGGDDRLISEEGPDVLDGGAGRDLLISKAGKDILMGGIGNDLLVAGLGDDFLQGDEGNDALAGGECSDTLFGGDGNDVLWGDGTYSVPNRTWNVNVTNPTSHTVAVTLDGIIGEITSNDDQADLLNGGAGDDVLFGAGGNDQLYGGDDSDFLIGGDGSDRLEGGSGDDNLFGDNGNDRTLIGNDILLGGAGNDFLQGGYGDDELDGGAGDDEIHGDYIDDPVNGGNDTITAGDGNDIVLAGAGDDVIDAGTGDDYVDGGQGSDTILAGDGTDSVIAGEGNDTVFGDAGSDTLEGNAGDDSLDGGDGNDVLFGNDGIDQLSGGAGLDFLLGGTGDDTLSGGDDSDQLAGGGGNDVIHGDGSDDTLFGEDGDDTLYGDAGNDRLQGSIGSDQLFGGDGSDILIGEADDDTLSGGAGNDELQGNDGNDVLQGEAGNDLLFGQAGDDVLDGGGGDDNLQGGDGTDFLYGGQGADSLTGGLGNDTYQFNRGDGADNVFDEGGALDVLSLGPNITAGDISITTQGSDLTVTLLNNGLPTADTITLTNWFNADNQIESIQFNDGTVWDVTGIQSRLPEEIALVDGLNAQGSSNVTTYTFTPGTDNPDGFNITVTDAGGLDTLQFEQVTDTTSTATPSLTGYSRDGNDLVLDVTVVSSIGTIPVGSGHIRLQDYYTSSGFIENITFPNGSLNVPNQVPVVNIPPTDQIAAIDTAFSYTLPTDTFSDSPFDVLTISTSLTFGEQLPAWLSFDAATLTFSGTPTSDDSASLDINIMARDSGGLTATAGFGLNVGNVNVAPVVKAGIRDQVATEGVPYKLTIPGDAFIDRNPGDLLSYTALSADGSSLPLWLTFNTSTDTFTGTPSQSDIGLFNVRVVTEDDAGLSTSDTFSIDVKYSNDAPQINQPLANQSLIENTSFSFQLPADSFTDPDLSFGDSLSYAASQADGTSLPSWLFFNDNSLTFSGTPRGVDSDTTFDVAVMATDKAGLSASNTFQVDVTDTGPSEIHEFQLSKLDGTNGFTLQSNEEQDVLGMAVGSAGDINGDGFNDFIVGASHENVSAGTVDIGRSFVVFGLEDGFSANMNISQLEGTNGFRIDGVDIGNPYSSDQLGESVSGGADLNGDGFDDLIIGEPGYKDANNTSFAGAAYVVYGKKSGFDPAISVMDLNGKNGFKINGNLGVRAEFGRCVSNAGDINADGLDDFVVGAPSEDKAYVIFGIKAATNPELSVNDINGTNGFVIESQDSSSDNLGFSVSTLGDFNGDGIDDLIVGSFQEEGLFEATGDPNIDLNYNNGAAYIIYGKDIEFDASLDVNNLDGNNGFTVYGINSSDRIGYSVSGGGDINGDGFDDAIIGAPNDNGVNTPNREGATYILFGNKSGFQPEISLADLDGSYGFRIVGAVARNYSGFSVSNAGDVNGDGFSDILIGADNVNVPGEPTYLIYGKATGFAPEINLDTLDGVNGLVITNQSTDKERPGRSVSGIGDINGDGFDDLLLGAPYANPGGKNSAGEAHVIFGGDFPDSIEYLGTTGNDVLNITGNNNQIFTLGGIDTVNVSGGNYVSINSGAGNDTINLNGVSNADVTTGLGNNTVNISGTSTSGTSTTTINTGQRSTTQTTVATTAGNQYVIVSPSLNGGSGQVYDVYTQQQVSASDVILRKGSMIVDILSGQVELHFEGVDMDNLINGPVPFDKININDTLTLTYDSLLAQGFDIDGTAGDDVLDGTEVMDRITGFGGDDILNGGNGDDTLSGGDGADTLQGGIGDDILEGGTGDDVLMGGAGDDTYVYHYGDGSDTLDDSGGVDQVVYGSGISADALTVEQVENDLIVNLSTTDQLVIRNWFTDPAQRIDRFVFNDGDLTLFTADEIEGLINTNQPPVVNAGIADQATDEDAPFAFTIPTDAFTDPDPGAVLAYSATASTGGPLPDWLTFDSNTRTFIGTPDNNDVGAVDIAVTATDPVGETATDSFQVVVNNVNDAPVLANPLQDQAVDQDAPFSFTIPADTFQDDDAIHGDTQTFSVDLADGGALPAWLQFDQLTRTLSGTPGNNDIGVDDLQVTVTDSGGLTTSDVFRVTIKNVNDPPELASPIPDKNTREGDNFLFSIPTGTFKDIDIGDSLKLIATMEDGSTLPEWLTFRSDTGLFSGNIPYDAAGFYSIAVTASDLSGVKVSDVFTLSVTNVINGDRRNNFLHGTDLADVINSFRGNDRLFGRAGNDELNGGNGHDLLSGDAGNDTLYGGNGNDVLLDRHGNNYFNGGTGNDRLYGGYGDDVYKYNKGDGRDRIMDSGGNDTLQFGSNIKMDDIKFRRHGLDMVLEIGDKHNRVLIDDWYRDKSKIENFSFDDGTVVTEKQLQQLVQNMSWFGIKRQGHIEHAEVHGMEENSKWFTVNWNFH